MKANPSYQLILAMLLASLAKGAGVADLVAKAENGDAAAQLELGGIYSKSDGVTKDCVEAV